MIRQAMAIVLGMVLAFAPTMSRAQIVPPPGGGQRQRLELERRLQMRFGQQVRDQLGLTQEQFQSLEGVMRSFQEERQTLNRSQASLRYRLRDPGLAEIGDDAARELLREMISLQEQELSLYRREQEQLLQVLTPAQVVRFYRLREDLGQRVQALRQGRGGGMGAGPGGGVARGPGGGMGGRLFR